jgi:hypothetical protein
MFHDLYASFQGTMLPNGLCVHVKVSSVEYQALTRLW